LASTGRERGIKEEILRSNNQMIGSSSAVSTPQEEPLAREKPTTKPRFNDCAEGTLAKKRTEAWEIPMIKGSQ